MSFVFISFQTKLFPLQILWFDTKGGPSCNKACGRIESRLDVLRSSLSPSKKKQQVKRKTFDENIEESNLSTVCEF